MTAVVLAAGIASRLRPLTNHIPKCLLPLAGKPLLQRTLLSLQHAGVERCAIVTGYLNEMVEVFVNSLRLKLRVEFVHNPLFESTNNNYSLWLSHSAVNGDSILLLDADILFDERIIAHLIASSYQDALILRTSKHLGHEEIKCQLDDAGSVVQIGKHLDPRISAGESVGIEKFSPDVTQQLFAVLSRRKTINEFYEASFQEVIDSGAKIYAVDSGDFACMEIDTPDDLAAAELLAQQLP